FARNQLRLFHNVRTALHVPYPLPAELPPPPGPGRNNAFGLLSVALFNEPTIYGPAKFGVAWNLTDRKWVHWDGNTNSPLVRNLAASLGLGAPLVGKKGMLEFALVDRHTKLSEQIRAPKYPWKIDRDLAAKGEALFKQNCAKCHVQSAADEDKRLYALDEIKTDANRAKLFNEHQSQLYNKFFGELEIPGYEPVKAATRCTQKYVAIDLAGVWARSPYLHNGSVRTMADLLAPAAERPKSFKRGSREFDDQMLGYTDDGAYLFDTKTDGNSNAGHEYGTQLGREERRQLIEYLKTL
ncbi:MAG: c-type cytochrome, partial [Deltaproteobacteria bacterium]|nr:c-type cytochrome [Deltaproteobacteria bacterium]